MVSTLIKYNLNSTTTQIAFTITGNLYQFNWWYIDNVSITGPTAPTSTALAAINLTSSGATLKGTVNPKLPAHSQELLIIRFRQAFPD
jgi:hypothetical protein